MRKASAMAAEKKWELTQEAFAKALDWLDQDVGRAGERYEEIRATLIEIFLCRGCPMAEDLADETIDRVIRKLDAVKENYLGDPARYFFGVAQMIHLEHLRRRPESTALPEVTGLDYTQQDYDCLENCLGQLTMDNRRFIEVYYQDDGPSKMSNRKALAHSLGVSPNLLRVRAYRIREHLRKCVEGCRRKKTAR